MATQNSEPKEIQKKERESECEFIPLGASDAIRLSASVIRNLVAVPTNKGHLPSEKDCIYANGL